MPFDRLDRAAIARTLAQIADHDDDLVDAYFERLEEIELPPEGEAPGLRVRREEGFAVRLVREGRTWLAAHDEIAAGLLGDALRQVARVLPSASYPEPLLEVDPWPEVPAAPELLEFPSRLHRAVRSHHVAFPMRVTVRRHRRSLQVLGPRCAADGQQETFYSAVIELPWTRHGALAVELEEPATADLATTLVALFKARRAAPPEPYEGVAILGPAAAAVLLHEAVAHALEVDTLAAVGDPEAAVGLEMGTPLLDILDDPGSAPPPVRRTSDDEGNPVVRRWLLRRGVVAAPLSDALWARGSEVFAPGAARRAGRHDAPQPRSTHLELLAGETPDDDLLAGAEGGLYLPEASHGQLDPVAGTFRLAFPFGRRVRSGVVADPVGACRLEGRVADLLARVTAVGGERRSAGAGWCAKGGRKMPVWATAPALRLEGIQVLP